MNIATAGVAGKVERRIASDRYLAQLDAMQTQAKRLGYYFTQGTRSSPIPAVLTEVLTEAVVQAPRRASGSPAVASSSEEIIAALSDMGIRLRATRSAAALIEGETARRRAARRRQLRTAAGRNRTDGAASIPRIGLPAILNEDMSEPGAEVEGTDVKS
ncbi:MAG: hypothetical protein ABIW82_17015 [Dokdonella sp.]